ncbi:MAG: HDOD domain-containing protein [Zoogloeaceae bacterium]|nr:HDOD domain-containing protein [Zoogloeaceae bacterium]
MPRLDSPLGSAEAYVAYFSAQALPVLKHTARALDAMREDGERINAKRLAGVVLSDPLMTLKLLTHMETHRRHSQNHDITTIDRAIMMMGVEPFFHAFEAVDTVEEALATHPKALLGVLQVIGRARRAAHIARDWAILRHDVDVEEITVAALLREAVDVVCWIYAPRLTAEVYARQREDRSLRSTAAQAEVFGVDAHQIQLGLIHAWRLPKLLIDLLDDRESANPRVRNVVIAANLARHSSRGWDNSALADDFLQAAALLHTSPEILIHRIGMPVEDQAPLIAQTAVRPPPAHAF